MDIRAILLIFRGTITPLQLMQCVREISGETPAVERIVVKLLHSVPGDPLDRSYGRGIPLNQIYEQGIS